MNVERERTSSLWMEVPAIELPRLRGAAETEVLVIGAGIAGLTTAYQLMRGGRRVMVVDRGRVARGMTARTTAHLAFALDDGFRELAGSRGTDAARHWYESQAAAVDLLERILREEEIGCDFTRLDGVLMAATEDDLTSLDKELEAARSAGFVDAERIPAGTLPGQEHDALRFPRQARFHPLKFLNGLIEVLRRNGATLFQDTAITQLEDAEGKVVASVDGGGAIHARQVVVATNSPFHLRIPVHTKQAPYRTFVVAAPVPKGSVADVLFWDTLDPYHYVRLQPGEQQDWLIVGGEDYKSGTEDSGAERHTKLEAWARARWPQMGKVAYAWSGQVYEPADMVGFVGRSPQHREVYLVTGDSGQGMTTGAVAALLLPELMSGREHPWTSLYEPSRQMVHGLGAYLKENLEAATHWLELLGPGEVGKLDELGPGHGAVVKLEGKPLAAYRDPQGGLHLHSALCTHAGCEVHWNTLERCWDCPCHGSQFTPTGDVLAGPATRPLKRGSLDASERPPDAVDVATEPPRDRLH